MVPIACVKPTKSGGVCTADDGLNSPDSGSGVDRFLDHVGKFPTFERGDHMRRMRIAVAGLFAAGLGIAGGVGVAGAAPAPLITPAASVAGSYVVQVNWDNGGWGSNFGMTLNSDGTASSSCAGDTGVWSYSHHKVTVNWDSGVALYLGKKHKSGFDSLKKPGTMSNNAGDSGLWYATSGTTSNCS
jgi:hypothetical protein